MNDNRTESFLRLIRRSQRGRLKIYLGYAAGVGKTFQMLLEAHRLKEDGIDVAVGLVETHGRAETEALLQGLEVIPRAMHTYHGIAIDEMDRDAILSRRPGVVLIDELAHTNVPGIKNAKRYQDVEEILAAGIHVISTLNVQHLESLYETVERITGVKVRERIPDRVILEADQLLNVDVTTEDLCRRLKEGKVYTRERIETALDHFFTATNLEQLRELTLRELAAQIDSRRRDPFAENLPASPDQVMVALSSRGPNSDALLRHASRLAGRLNRNWYAVYVQTAKERPTVIDATTQRILANTLTLAQQLGATVFTFKGDDIVRTLLQFAKEYRVGHVVIGTPGRKPPLWRRLRGEVSIVERLMREGRGLTVVVVDTKAIPDTQQAPKPARRILKLHRNVGEKVNPVHVAKAALLDSGAFIWDAAIEKEAAMRRLLDARCHERKAYREAAWKALLLREEQGETFVGADVAIPHARLPGLRQPMLALGIGKSGIENRKTGSRVRIMLLLLSPIEPAECHVEMLATICRMARDDAWRRHVLSAKRVSDVIDGVRAWADRQLASNET